MRQLAIYGKGGIGKSTVAAHLSYTFADRGLKVLQVGCSPKNDSTRPLLEDFPKSILDVLRDKDFDYEMVTMDDIVYKSPIAFKNGGTVYCAESGGPEPGVGCGGKGVVEAIETLTRLNVFKDYSFDVVIYDILGDVVCGGFSLPIRQGYAAVPPIAPKEELVQLEEISDEPIAQQKTDEQLKTEIDEKISDYYGVSQVSDAVVFVTLYPRASNIQIAGDFNNWQPEKNLMEKVGETGVWQSKIKLPAGKYRYRLVVDGQWQQDPYNERSELNPYGEYNSVLEVK